MIPPDFLPPGGGPFARVVLWVMVAVFLSACLHAANHVMGYKMDSYLMVRDALELFTAGAPMSNSRWMHKGI